MVPVVCLTPDHDQDVPERGRHCHNISQALKVNLRMDQISFKSKLVHFQIMNATFITLYFIEIYFGGILIDFLKNIKLLNVRHYLVRKVVW